MKYHISQTWVYRLETLDNSCRHWWMFNLISGDLWSLRGWEFKIQGLIWKASYRRRRNWPWQACFLGTIFNSFVLILLVTRLMTFLWFFFLEFMASCAGRWLWLHWYPQLLASSLWELCCVWMLLYIERNANMKRKWLQMQARQYCDMQVFIWHSKAKYNIIWWPARGHVLLLLYKSFSIKLIWIN